MRVGPFCPPFNLTLQEGDCYDNVLDAPPIFAPVDFLLLRTAGWLVLGLLIDSGPTS